MALSRKRRGLIEKRYGLEDGETDGMSLRQIERLVHEEKGALDMYKCLEWNELLEFLEE